ncbi:hypothetical protein [Streptomyces sp. NPDC048272]|uniref:hypothetical protein n=1 Tax=Streptomyces sp. NPDC048272 TaxID=3154616 RepID=UPI003442C602
MPDLHGRAHDVDICPDCDGVRAHRWQRVDERNPIRFEAGMTLLVTGMSAGPFGLTGGTDELFVSAPDPCTDEEASQ